MMVIGYVKQTASRKTEQSKFRWKDENQSSLNSRSFKELLVNKRLETSSSPGYTNKKRTSYVYHIQFPLIFQFLGGDCIFFFFHGFSPSGDCIFFFFHGFSPSGDGSITETSGLFSSSLLYL